MLRSADSPADETTLGHLQSMVHDYKTGKDLRDFLVKALELLGCKKEVGFPKIESDYSDILDFTRGNRISTVTPTPVKPGNAPTSSGNATPAQNESPEISPLTTLPGTPSPPPPTTPSKQATATSARAPTSSSPKRGRGRGRRTSGGKEDDGRKDLEESTVRGGKGSRGRKTMQGRVTKGKGREKEK